MEKLLKAVSKEGSELKVIHLVRDPRAILSSMWRNKKAWRPYLRVSNGTLLCANMIHNNMRIREMMSIGILNKDNFYEINYDDWMENLWGQIVRLYSFLDIQLTDKLVEKIQAHFSSEHARLSYLSTFRGSNHNKDRWMSELDENQKAFIEKQCGELIQEKKEFTEVTIDYGDVEEDGSGDNDEVGSGADLNISKW